MEKSAYWTNFSRIPEFNPFPDSKLAVGRDPKRQGDGCDIDLHDVIDLGDCDDPAGEICASDEGYDGDDDDDCQDREEGACNMGARGHFEGAHAMPPPQEAPEEGETRKEKRAREARNKRAKEKWERERSQKRRDSNAAGQSQEYEKNRAQNRRDSDAAGQSKDYEKGRAQKRRDSDAAGQSKNYEKSRAQKRRDSDAPGQSKDHERRRKGKARAAQQEEKERLRKEEQEELQKQELLKRLQRQRKAERRKEKRDARKEKPDAGKAKPPPGNVEHWDDVDTTTCKKCGILKCLTWSRFQGDTCDICIRDPRRWEGLLPDTVPDCLQNLTMLEEMLISLQLPLMHLSALTPNGQLGYRAHTTCVEQSIGRFVTDVLPRNPKSLEAVLCTVRRNVFKKKGKKATTTAVDEPFESDVMDFKVRPHRLREALLWLKEHNHLYSHIQIDDAWFVGRPNDFHFYGHEYQVDEDEDPVPAGKPAECVMSSDSEQEFGIDHNYGLQVEETDMNGTQICPRLDLDSSSNSTF